MYSMGIFTLLVVGIGVPLAFALHHTPTCFDGVQNQGETAIDKGGPCAILDEQSLSPVSVLWARSFLIRPNSRGGGVYSAVAYVENLNKNAAIRRLSYRVGLYDDENVLVGERVGVTFVMPGTITPIFETGIDSGYRTVAHTYLDITNAPVWERAENSASSIRVRSMSVIDITHPRLDVAIENKSVIDAEKPSFVVVLFDASGNAFSASATALPNIRGGDTQSIVFTWPSALPSIVGRIDVLPRMEPRMLK